MQHIVNIAFDFDDQKAKAAAEKAVEGELDKIIKDIILDKIAPYKTKYYTINRATSERDWSGFREKIDQAVDGFLNENKGLIIDEAANKLVERLSRSKAWKEKTMEVLG